jgi:hypothetical protein
VESCLGSGAVMSEIEITFDIISTRALTRTEVEDLQDAVVYGLKKYAHTNNGGPNDNCGEGLFDIDDGTVLFYTYKLRHDHVCEAVLYPRDATEVLLNQNGLTTYELFD